MLLIPILKTRISPSRQRRVDLIPKFNQFFGGKVVRHVSNSELVCGFNRDAHVHKVDDQLVGASLFSHRVYPKVMLDLITGFAHLVSELTQLLLEIWIVNVVTANTVFIWSPNGCIVHDNQRNKARRAL